MERLTKIENINGRKVIHYEVGSDKILERLADYEDEEEQGLLIHLPFKINQKIYYIFEDCFWDGLCIDRDCSNCKHHILAIEPTIFRYNMYPLERTYYATYEEAEEALKERLKVSNNEVST